MCVDGNCKLERFCFDELRVIFINFYYWLSECMEDILLVLKMI